MSFEVRIQDEPVIFYARSLTRVAAEFPALLVPAPTSVASPGSLADSSLLLPVGDLADQARLVAHSANPLFEVAWRPFGLTNFLVPGSVERERWLRDSWRVRVMPTPSSVGVDFEPKVFSSIGWSLLAGLDRSEVVKAAIALAFRLENPIDRDTTSAWIIDHMALPSGIQGSLRARLTAGDVPLNPAALRWIALEMASATEAELTQLCAERSQSPSDELLIETVLTGADLSDFAGLAMTAFWLLHESFSGSAGTDDLAERVASMTFGLPQGSGWWTILDRWIRIWQIEDDHLSVAKGPLLPSQLRADFTDCVGIDPVVLLSWAESYLAIWCASPPEDKPVVFDEFVQRFNSMDELIVQGPELTVLRRLLVRPFDELCAASSEARGHDRVGSAPQQDSTIWRDAPIIEFENGHSIPASPLLVTDRVASLHQRYAKRLRPQSKTLIGDMFEAAALTYADRRLKPPHLTIAEHQIKTVAAGRKSCDLIVGHRADASYVCVEFSLQTTQRRVANGEPGAVAQLVDRYQTKIDQAATTIDYLPEITSACNAPAPRSATALLVTDRPMTHTPLFADTMRSSRSDRAGKLVCSIDEFEEAIDLAEAGWSFPGIVEGWQADAHQAPLSIHLERLAQLRPPNHKPDDDAPWRSIFKAA